MIGNPSHRWRTKLTISLLAPVMLLAPGCGSPDKANIDLRKKNQTLQNTIDGLRRQHDADLATLRGISTNATTVPSLPQDQISQLFTVAGLKFNRLTGGYHDDSAKRGDTMLKVYVFPADEQGDAIKAAGAFRVELFDLAMGNNPRIGLWDFDLQSSRAAWQGGALLYCYVLNCPWQTPPTHTKLLARVTFTDALTHRVITLNQPVTVELP
jgi:hypothetical protein